MTCRTIILPGETEYTVAVKVTHNSRYVHRLPLDGDAGHVVVVMEVAEYTRRMAAYTTILREQVRGLRSVSVMPNVLAQVDSAVVLGLELHAMTIALEGSDDEPYTLLREDVLSVLRYLHTKMRLWQDALKHRLEAFQPEYFAFVQQHPLFDVSAPGA